MAQTKSELKEISPVERELSIVISGESIAKEIDKAYQRLQQKAQLKGFRPGKAPRQVLEQYYAAQVERDVLNQVLNDGYKTAIVEHKLEPVADPKVESKSNFAPGTDFTFTAKVEIKPTVKLKKYKGLKIKIEASEDNSTVERELQRLQDQQSTIRSVTDREKIEDGDLVQVDVAAEIDGDPSKELSGLGQTIEIGAGRRPAEEKALKGKKLGSSIKAKVEQGEKTANLVMTIKSIQVRERPALDDDFAKDVSEQFASLEDLKKAIQDQLDAMHKQRDDNARKAAAVEALIAQNPFDLPNSMIDQQAEYSAMRVLQQLPEQQAQQLWQMHGAKMKEEARPHAEQTVRGALLCEQVAKAENIEVADADLEAELMTEAKRMGVSVAKLRAYYKKSDMEAMRMRIMNERALQFVIDNADVKSSK